MSNITFTTVSEDSEIWQILDLQARNHVSVVSQEVIDSQGFVFVKHEPEVLFGMNRAAPSVIAKDGEKVVGYCLVMPQSFRAGVPVLEPMFAMLETLCWKGRSLRDWRWFTMGQVCVAEGYRGQGVFDGMYAKLREVGTPENDCVITEVAARNRRSMRAHERIGFETIHQFEDAAAGEFWSVLLWDWTGG